jgi:3-hydroxyisobutyrate dehydrogenase-like beta-hydroxyacid dehydrogenase
MRRRLDIAQLRGDNGAKSTEHPMTEIFAVIAAGEMGSGIGKRLTERGVRVLTSLQGRGPGSVARARDAGMAAVDDAELVAQASIILSVVPPGQAVGLAERLKPALAQAAHNPLYVDCNAIAPQTAEQIGATLAGAHCRYIDGGIVGGPPAGSYSPNLYVSGPAAAEALALTGFGLNVRVLEGPVGAASALKMSYAGITKGFTAIGTAMMLGSARAGCADALRRELLESQPQLATWLTRQVPRMFPKAYRWIAEMEEIAAFLGEDPASHDIYAGIARLYDRMAAGAAKMSPDAEGELVALRAFCADAPERLSKAG